MKKSPVKSFLLYAVVVGIFLTMIGLIIHYSKQEPSVPSFSFLNGRKPAYNSTNNSRTQYRITQYIYSFEADLDDFFWQANKELLALGFIDKGPGLWHRDYVLVKGPYERISVRIHKKQKLSVYSTPESSDYSSPDQHEFHIRDGWVSVTVSVEVFKWRFRVYDWISRIF